MRLAAGTLAALALLAGPGPAAAATRGLPVGPVPTGGVTSRGVPSQALLRPGSAKVGERVLYRGRVVLPRASVLRWRVPPGGDTFEWGPPRTRRIPAYSGSRSRSGEALPVDTAQIELTLQAFTPGLLSVPGLGFEVRLPGGPTSVGRLPMLRLPVIPVVGPDDTSAALRPLRGPLGAPWWERVPWRIVGAAAAVLLALGAVVWRIRRRRRGPVAGTAPVAPPRDPATAALEALEALRGRGLPEQGRFAEHAFELTRILRRFLEATQGAPRPGDTTPELLRHLSGTRLGTADLERLGVLLAAWDRVKFARAASSPAEARRAEDSVAELARRRLAAPGGEAA